MNRKEWLQRVIELAPWEGKIVLDTAVFYPHENVTIDLWPPLSPPFVYPRVTVWYDPDLDTQFMANRLIRSKDPGAVIEEVEKFYEDFAHRFGLPMKSVEPAEG